MAKASTHTDDTPASDHNPKRAKQLQMGQGAPAVTPQPEPEETTDGDAAEAHEAE